MKSTYRQLGDFLEPIDIRNVEGSEENLLGLSVQKTFIPSIANTVGTDFTKYKMVRKGQFAYIPDTSRRGDKIAIALLKGWEQGLVSNVYTVFEVKPDCGLLPEYLELWFKRPEFDRYARFKSHGSVRELFDWDQMCAAELPVPSVDHQREIVSSYKSLEERINLLCAINETLASTIDAVYKINISGCPNPDWKVGRLGDLCTKIGSGATPRGGKAAYNNGGISLIRSTNVFDYRFSYDDLAKINNEQAEKLSNVIVEPDDVLINITGVSVARCCVVPEDVLPARVNQHVMIVRTSFGKYLNYVVFATLCAEENKNSLLGISQSGSTREAINKQEMEDFEIVVPDTATIVRVGRVIEVAYKRIVLNLREIESLRSVERLIQAKLANVNEAPTEVAS